MSFEFSPHFVQKQSRVLTYTTYKWLSGEKTTPTFRIDISGQRVKLAEALSIYGIERLSGLPTCTAFESEIQLDPFKATCQPDGINYRTEQLSLQKSLLTSNSFLSKTVYTEGDLPKTKTGKTLPEAFARIPVFFQLLKPAFYSLLAVLVLLSFVLVALRPLKRNGWKDLGKALVYSCLVLAISAAIFGIFVPKLSRQYQSQFTGNGADVLVTDVVTYLSTHFETIFIDASLGLAAVGAIILLGVKFAPHGSRYKQLERVTGIANSVSPSRPSDPRAARAIAAPIVSSEKVASHAKIHKVTKKTQKVKKELA
jgi:hypothetical protein